MRWSDRLEGVWYDIHHAVRSLSPNAGLLGHRDLHDHPGPRRQHRRLQRRARRAAPAASVRPPRRTCRGPRSNRSAGYFVGTEGLSPPDYQDYRAQQHTFTDIAAYNDATATWLPAHGDPEVIRAARVTGNMFNVLGGHAARGTRPPAERRRSGAPDVAVISSRLFDRALGGDPSRLGRTLTIDGRATRDRRRDATWISPSDAGPTSGFRSISATISPTGADAQAALAQRDRAAAPGHDDRRRRSRAGVDRRPARGGPSRRRQQPFRDAGAAPDLDDRIGRKRTHAAARRGVAGAPHCLRQPRQPDAVAGTRSPPRHGGPRGTRFGPRTIESVSLLIESVLVAVAGGILGTRARVRRHALAARAQRQRPPGAVSGRRRRDGARLLRRHSLWEPVCCRASLRRSPWRGSISSRRSGKADASNSGGRGRRTGAPRAGRGADRVGGDTADRRRTAGALLPRARRREARLRARSRPHGAGQRRRYPVRHAPPR